MAVLERFGTGGVHDRRLALLHLASLDETPNIGPLANTHFACLLASDATQADYGAIGSFAIRLLSLGAVYVCAWGPGCERVHDIFDEEIVGGGPGLRRFQPHIMTTWHDSEPLDDALWYFLQSTYPDDAYLDSCRAAIAITIGNTSWRSRVREALSSPTEFCNAVIEREGSA